MNEFAALLKYYRGRARLSQTKLAEAALFDHSYTSRLEGATRKPSRYAVEKLAAVLKLNDDEYTQFTRAAGFATHTSTLDAAAAACPELLDVAKMLMNDEIALSYRASVRMMLKAIADLAPEQPHYTFRTANSVPTVRISNIGYQEVEKGSP